jgi:hypothetical protein
VKKTILLATIALGATTALAVPAFADVKEEYLAACLSAYGEESTEFCTCKAGEAVKLDEVLARSFIAFYEDPAKFREDLLAGNVPEQVQKDWPYFVMSSNKLCRPQDDVPNG